MCGDGCVGVCVGGWKEGREGGRDGAAVDAWGTEGWRGVGRMAVTKDGRR